MNTKFTFYIVALVIAFASCSEKKNQISFNEPTGVFVEEDASFSPDSNGVLKSYDIELPEYESGQFFTDHHTWPSYDNRLYPWFFKDSLGQLFSEEGFRIPTLNEPDQYGAMIILKLRDGSYLSLLPLTAQNATTRFHVNDGGELKIELLHAGTAKVNGDFPILSWAKSKDLYQATYKAWDRAASLPQLEKMAGRREEKTYPEMFNYLGWCTWQQYAWNTAVTQEGLMKYYNKLEASNMPVRWLLIDDGWQNTQNMELINFQPSPEKFPSGWEVLKEKKGEGKIKWTGLWHAFNGHWNGIHENHTLSGIDMMKHNDLLLVEDDQEDIQKYYERMAETTEEGGFDFVKVDVQARALTKYSGTKDPVSTVNQQLTALEEEVRRERDLGIINCMAMNTVQLFNTPYSTVTRVSQDYIVGNMPKAKSHIYQSYLSTIWLGYTVFPDHDMFHSSDSVSGRLMAVSKALSSAPVYLSDKPSEFIPENILPLTLSNGKLIKPLAPAVPIQRSIFKNVFDKPNPFIVSAPLNNKSAAIAAYNLTKSGTEIQGEIKTEDYKDASAMILPYEGKWEIPEEGLFIYEWDKQTGEVLKDSKEFTINGFDDRYYILSPIKENWAVIGLANKFLSSGAVNEITYEENKLKVNLKEGGNFVFYSKYKPQSNQYDIESMDNNLWKIKIPQKLKDFDVEINRFSIYE